MEPLPERSLVGRLPPWISPELAQSLHQSLRFSYEFGLLDREEAEQVLKSYVLRDVDGRAWAIGAASGRWYWRSGGEEWVGGEPPPALKPPDLDLSRYVARGRSAAEGKSSQVTGAPAGPIEPAASAGNLACPSCRALNQSGAAFCVSCGSVLRRAPEPPPVAPLPPPPAPGFCTYCGAREEPGMRFCTTCGNRMGG